MVTDSHKISQPAPSSAVDTSLPRIFAVALGVDADGAFDDPVAAVGAYVNLRRNSLETSSLMTTR